MKTLLVTSLASVGFQVLEGCRDALVHLYISDLECNANYDVLAGFEEGVVPVARKSRAAVAAPPGLESRVEAMGGTWVNHQLYVHGCVVTGWGVENIPLFARLLYRIALNRIFYGVCSYSLLPGTRLVRHGSYTWLLDQL